MKTRVGFTAMELNTIEDITNRARPWFPDRDWREIKMDVMAAHTHMPLRLRDLAKADDTNFVHDIAGITRHLNRETFVLEDCFVPRFAERA